MGGHHNSFSTSFLPHLLIIDVWKLWKQSHPWWLWCVAKGSISVFLFYVCSHRGDIRPQSIKYITSQPFSTLLHWRANQYACTTRSSELKQESTSLMHWNPTPTKQDASWPENVEMCKYFHCRVLIVLFYHPYLKEIPFFGLRSNFLRVQSCGSLFTNEEPESIGSQCDAHLCHTCWSCSWHQTQIARQMATLTAVFLQLSTIDFYFILNNQTTNWLKNCCMCLFLLDFYGWDLWCFFVLGPL